MATNEGTGSLLSRDFTQGYGPEVYILKENASTLATERGKSFQVFAKYYASHQDSKLTGTTSAVIWTIQKESVGENKKNRIKFNFVRLDTNQEKTHVATATLEGSTTKDEEQVSKSSPAGDNDDGVQDMDTST